MEIISILRTFYNNLKDNFKVSKINGYDVNAIGSPFKSSSDLDGSKKTHSFGNGWYLHYAISTDNGWLQCREHGGNGNWQLRVYGSTLDSINGDPLFCSAWMGQYDFVSLPTYKGAYFGIISQNSSANHTFRLFVNRG